MKILLNWLKEFVDIKVKPDKLIYDLSLFGHEVEEAKKIGNDYFIDFEITANRGDCLSHLGMAREISALYQTKIKNIILNQFPKEIKIKNQPIVKIEDDILCPRYSGVVITNFKVTDSPKWLQNRLLKIGIRPINNIVDITNYVMMELGQPLHAFDLKKINKQSFNIRFSKKGEKITTLDGIERSLNDKIIIIEDGKKIFDLAGIMGGANSEINEKTSLIFLQAAIFNAKLVRFASKFLNIKTEASYRYERGVDIDGTFLALQRCLNLINQVCPTSKTGKIIDFIGYKPYKKIIPIDINKINHFLGSNFSDKDISKYLSRINFIYDNGKVTIPSYRHKDINIWQDITQEISRLDKFKNIKPAIINIKAKKSDKLLTIINNQRQFLANNGFCEIYSYSFAQENSLKLLGYNVHNLKKVINSVSPEIKYLRPCLDISLLMAVAKNPWAPDIRFFEIGKVFTKNKEFWQIGIITDAKNLISLKEIICKITKNHKIIEAKKNILDYLKIRKKLYYTIINLSNTRLIKAINNKSQNIKPKIQYHKISIYPPSIRDVAFIVDNKINYKQIINSIYNSDNSIFIVELFDEFKSDKIGKNKKSLAFHIWMQNMSAPMQEGEIENIMKKIIKDISKKYNAILRS